MQAIDNLEAGGSTAGGEGIGVYLSVLGFGTGNYQDNKMQELADKGNGNHSYIDNITALYEIIPVGVKDEDAASANFRFASSVAEFGMLLRNSAFKESCNLPAWKI